MQRTTSVRQLSLRRRAVRAPSPWQLTWLVVVPTLCLGGNPEFEAVEKMRELGLDPNTNSEAYEARWPEVLKACEDAQQKSIRKSPSSVACTCSVLSVTSPAVSTTSCAVVPAVRVTQGSPASPVVDRRTDAPVQHRHGNPPHVGSPEDSALDSKIVSRAIATAQANVEGRNAEQRKNVLKYDDVLNRQRRSNLQGPRPHPAR